MNTYPFITQKYTAPIVALELAKSWLEMDIEGYEGKDDLIEACIKSAISSVETECNFQLGVSTYEWNTNCRPGFIPDTFFVQSLESVTQSGTDINNIYVPDTHFKIVRISKRKTAIYWKTWTEFFDSPTWYKVIFTAGLTEVPEDLLMAIRARIGEYYVNNGDKPAEKRTLSDKLLAPYIIGYAG